MNQDSKGNNMPSVKIKENEPFDVALRRFKRACEKAGILADVRARECYEKPTTIRKRDAAAAVKRQAKKVQRECKQLTRLYSSPAGSSLRVVAASGCLPVLLVSCICIFSPASRAF